MNSTWYEQADDYLHGRMSPEAQSVFESLLADNKEVAAEFEIYRSIEISMQQLEQGKEEEEGLKRSLAELRKTLVSGEKPGMIRRMPNRAYPWMAAAVVLLTVVGVYFFSVNRHSDPQQLAEKYIGDHLTILSQKMSGVRDSLQMGIAAYNNKDYPGALLYFEGVAARAPENSDAKKYSGLVFLQMRDYANALARFDELAALTGLYSNPGLFLKAVTLLRRNGEGDIPQARVLLEQVVREKAEGYEEATELLKKI